MDSAVQGLADRLPQEWGVVTADLHRLANEGHWRFVRVLSLAEPRILDELLDLAESDDVAVRSSAAEAVAAVDSAAADERERRILVRGLADPVVAVRSAVLRGLERAPARASSLRGELQRAMVRENDHRVRVRMAGATLLGAPGDERAIAILTEGACEEWEVSTVALLSFVRAGVPCTDTALVCFLREDPEGSPIADPSCRGIAQTRTVAIKHMVRVGRESLPILKGIERQVVGDAGRLVRVAQYMLQDDWSTPTLLPAIIGFAKSAHSDLRHFATFALGMGRALPPEEAVRLLTRLVMDPDEYVFSGAMAALARLCPESVAALASIVQDDFRGESERRRAARALRSIGAPGTGVIRQLEADARIPLNIRLLLR